MTIRKLSPRLTNQIAAGEVVERPASVVKELLENSIDAGATRIDIQIERGGVRLIRILDNGKGIPASELALALARHATSKIAHVDDLKAIESLGFRGEALASISSVSHLIMASRQAQDDKGHQVSVSGQEMVADVVPAAVACGTLVEVRDLFFNVPARRKFLRTEATEFNHIEETVKRVALAAFDTAFVLKHNNKVIRRYPAVNDKTQALSRIKAVLGKTIAQRLLAVDATLESSATGRGDASSSHSVRLWGWITAPQFHQSLSSQQYLFVNGRAVKDRVLGHAIKRAYAERLPEGRSPAFVLYLDIDPEQVDVNVHPTKHEVRLSEARRIHDFIEHAVIEALEQVVSPAASDVSRNPPVASDSAVRPPVAASVSGKQLRDSAEFQYQALAGAESRQADQSTSGDSSTQIQTTAPSTSQGFSQTRSRGSAARSEKPRAGGQQCWLLDGFALYRSDAVADGILLVNLAELSRAVARYYLRLSADACDSRPLMIPASVTISDIDASALSLSQAFGFELTQSGPNSYLLRRVPKWLESCAEAALVENWLSRLSNENSYKLNPELTPELMRSSLIDSIGETAVFSDAAVVARLIGLLLDNKLLTKTVGRSLKVNDFRGLLE